MHSLEYLSQREVEGERDKYFESICSDLLSIFLSDIYWMRSFKEVDRFNIISDLPKFSISRKPHDFFSQDFPSYKRARIELDDLIIKFVEKISPDDLNETISYKTSLGSYQERKFSSILGHMFNFQTHNRGMIKVTFNQMKMEIGSLDIIKFMN